MGTIIGIVSQKGGVGKSTLARALACEYTLAGWQVKIADLDTGQATSRHWQVRRLQNSIEPAIAVESFGTVAVALKAAAHYDLMIMDGAPHATQGTVEIAKHSDLLVIPTGLALDDLEPSIRLADDLTKQHQIPKQRITFALCRVGTSEAEIAEARDYIQATRYTLLNGAIPEKVSYRRGSDVGYALTEVRHKGLKHRADELIQSIIDTLN